jgi:predicted TIM-barrel fold metal-dependent hydrolase
MSAPSKPRNICRTCTWSRLPWSSSNTWSGPRALPAEKLLFGSDAPLVDARVEYHKIKLLRLSPEKEEKVLGGNIRRLLGI